MAFRAFVKEERLAKHLAVISDVMKKIFFTVVTFCGIWAGAHLTQMNSVSAQTSAFTGIVIPLTNQIAFTNTVAETTNLSALQLADVVSLLLTLQTNLEQTLPALAFVESNATFVNVSAPNPVLGAVAPLLRILPAWSRYRPTPCNFRPRFR